MTTGVGFGVPMTGTFGTVDVTGATGDDRRWPTLDCAGRRQALVFVRALDAAGNWGVIGSAILNLPKTGPQTTNGSSSDIPANGTRDVTVSATGDDTAAGGTITDAEYFLDTAGANGTRTAADPQPRRRPSSPRTGPSRRPTSPASARALHHVFVHSKDSLGLWGPTARHRAPVDLTGPAVDAAIVGPNPTNGLSADKGNPGIPGGLGRDHRQGRRRSGAEHHR